MVFMKNGLIAFVALIEIRKSLNFGLLKPHFKENKLKIPQNT